MHQRGAAWQNTNDVYARLRQTLRGRSGGPLILSRDTTTADTIVRGRSTAA
jgi:hypothetical protein